MKENGLVEFRWHGRGGQGAKTACLLLADAAFSSGKFVQGFPEYGPERMGAPITAYNRISDDPVQHPLQHRLPRLCGGGGRDPAGHGGCHQGPVPDGGGDRQHSQVPRGDSGQAPALDGAGVHHRRPPDLRGDLGPATSPTPPCSAAGGAGEPVCWRKSRFKQDMEESFRHKFAAKPQVVAGNMAALMQAVGGGAGRMIRPAREIDEHTPWQEMTLGGEVYETGHRPVCEHRRLAHGHPGAGPGEMSQLPAVRALLSRQLPAGGGGKAGRH